MNRMIAIFAGCFLGQYVSATEALAQTINGQDLSSISSAATQAQQEAATALQQASAAQAAVPPVCISVPTIDTLSGTVGTSTPCTPPANNTRPTSVQAANTTLNADCSWAVTFARAFTSSTPIIYASVVLPSGATQPVPCFATVRSSTTNSGKCFPGQTTLLNLSIVTSGLSLNAFGSICTAGTAVMVVGREPTQ